MKRLREEVGITSEKLAKDAGINHNTLRRWETGHCEEPKLNDIKKLAKGFGTTKAVLEHYLESGNVNEIFKKEFVTNIREGLGEIENKIYNTTSPTIDIDDFGPTPCGAPCDSSQVPVCKTSIPREFVNGINPNRLLILHASGDSLIEEKIKDGDIILIEKDAEFVEGKLYAVNIPGNGCTVKKLFRTADGKARLVPANHKYPEMIFEEAQIVGRVMISYSPPIRH